jgi:hypothetical protein
MTVPILIKHRLAIKIRQDLRRGTGIHIGRSATQAFIEREAIFFELKNALIRATSRTRYINELMLAPN